jgi:hypothetical protein
LETPAATNTFPLGNKTAASKAGASFIDPVGLQPPFADGACAGPIRHANTLFNWLAGMTPCGNGRLVAGFNNNPANALKFPARSSDVGTYTFG